MFTIGALRFTPRLLGGAIARLRLALLLGLGLALFFLLRFLRLELPQRHMLRVVILPRCGCRIAAERLLAVVELGTVLGRVLVQVACFPGHPCLRFFFSSRAASASFADLRDARVFFALFDAPP